MKWFIASLIIATMFFMSGCEEKDIDPEYGTGGFYIHQRTPNGQPDVNLRHVRSYKIQDGIIMAEKNGVIYYVHMANGTVNITKEQ